MKKSTILVIGVVYPEVIKYLEDYMSTILSQTEQDFDLLILNDHVDKTIHKISPKSSIVIEIGDNISPAQIRFKGISYGIRNKYKNIVFTDTDDYFSENRVEASIRKLKNYGFVYNEFDLVDSKKKKLQTDLMVRLKAKHEYNTIDDIINENFFGLSNTAVNVEELKNLYIPKEIIAVDWWLFTLLLLNGCRGGFIKEAKTYYRQSEINLAGLGKKLNEKRLELGIKVKTNHYKNLIDYCRNNKLKKEMLIYKKKLGEMKKLSEEIEGTKFRKRYVDVINSNYENIFNGWWSEILSLREWRKYAN